MILKVSKYAFMGALVAVAAAGCAGKGSGVAAPAMEGAEEASAETQQAQVEKLTRRYIETDLRSRAESKNEVLRSHPYWYKEYAEYPQGSSAIEVQIIEADSRTTPYRARAEFPKVRFSTKMHRKRLDAERDNTFYRDTGYETLDYELRNGRWVRLGRSFVAEQSEEFVDGAWRPVQEQTERTEQPEEPKGILGRTWDRLTGGS